MKGVGNQQIDQFNPAKQLKNIASECVSLDFQDFLDPFIQNVQLAKNVKDQSQELDLSHVKAKI